MLPSDSARALLSALTTQKQKLTTLRSLTVVLNDSAAVCAFTDVLRSERKLDTAAKTSESTFCLLKKYIYIEKY